MKKFLEEDLEIKDLRGLDSIKNYFNDDRGYGFGNFMYSCGTYRNSGGRLPYIDYETHTSSVTSGPEELYYD